MKSFEEIIDVFQQEQKKLKAIHDPLIRANAILRLCNKCLLLMKQVVEHKNFESEAHEIHFFKNIKPVVMSCMTYYFKVRACELHLPKAGRNFKIQFLEKEMRRVNKFFSRNRDFVQYMEQGHTYMDHIYFTRHHGEAFILSPWNNTGVNPEFSTSHDMVRAKVQGMYRYAQFLRDILQKLHDEKIRLRNGRQSGLLVWTGSKTALVELIYALYADGSLNHGKNDLRTITHSFEDFLNIRLDNISKTYTEIKARKGSKTKYLDELGLNFQLKMEREDDIPE